MTGTLPRALESFFTTRLIQQRHASRHTIAAYRDTFRLLLRFVHARTGTNPSDLNIGDLNATMIGVFLNHLETDRGLTARSPNARLAAIRSFFTFAAFEHPEHASLIQHVLAIPLKRTETTIVTFLSDAESDALLSAPDLDTRLGRRDYALLLVAIRTGLRVSELTGLTVADVHFGTGAHLSCLGKGRKQRITPIDAQTRTVLQRWLRECDTAPASAVFAGPGGNPLTRDAIRRIVSRHVDTARTTCPSMVRTHISPHTLRHTCAMRLLHAGVDITIIALWLGHESRRTTEIYLHADLTVKERALDRTTPLGGKPGRYRPADELLTFLEGL